MNNYLLNKKVSLSSLSEFILTCLTVGETKVLSALRSVRRINSLPLKKYILDVTCKEFDLHPSFIYNEKIKKFTTEQKICFSAIVFFMKKHMCLTYKDIAKLLQLEIQWEILSKYNTVITKLSPTDDINRRYIRMINKIDKEIKNYLLNNYIPNGENED